MTDGASSNASTEPAARPPPQIRLGSSLLFLLAVILVVVSALVFAIRTRLADAVISSLEAQNASNIPARETLAGSYAGFAAISFVLAVLTVLGAVSVRRGRPWGRYLGIAVATLLGVLGVQSLVSGGAGLALILAAVEVGLAITIVAQLLSKPAAQWCARSRGQQA